MITIHVQGPYQPFVAKVGQHYYIMPSWKMIPDDTNEVRILWDHPAPIPTQKLEGVTRTVPASNGVGTYKVLVRNDGMKSCSCPGFLYRRKCKHVDALKKETGW